ncbi:MAG TPA: OstA-like protein [Bacteroidia bacterium]|nr:OstA-like protein [Bacteroidia bacterium]
MKNKSTQHIKNFGFVFLGIFFLLFSNAIKAQVKKEKQKKIQLIHANSLEYDKKLGEGVKRLIGNVAFKDSNVVMNCDSAYFFANDSLNAFGNIHVQQGDSINLYGNILFYDGVSKKAEVKGKVRFTEKDMMLTTDFLNYDMKKSVANYSNGGKIVDKENTLTSLLGYYYSATKELAFEKNVVLVNPQYTMKSDTLHYNTLSKTAYFFGPTTIKSKENSIYCENGWYDTKTNFSQYNKHAFIITKQQKMMGDSIFYDRNKGFGKAIKNVHIIDSVQNINVSGDYAEYYGKQDSSFVTGHALLMQTYSKDTLFLHADTLRAVTETNKKSPNDSLSHSKKIFAFHHVQFYKSDIQGKCDSMVYSATDSIMRFFHDPILWSDKSQLTADTIFVTVGNKEIKSLQLFSNSFIISQEDSVRFNQIKGKHMNGVFVKNKLYKIHVIGNGQTIYYAKDDQKSIGVNKADCSSMIIFMNKNKVTNITFITKPDATLYPFKDANPKDMILRNFTWRNSERPLSEQDIFR